MLTTCVDCGCANDADARFCGECGAALHGADTPTGTSTPIGPPPTAPMIHTTSAAPAEADHERDVQVWRDVLESFYCDGVLDAHERTELDRLRGDLRVTHATLDQIEREVRHQFRRRVAGRVQSSAFEAVRPGSHVTVTVELENLDREMGYRDVSCELHVEQLGIKQRETLPRFGYRSRQRRTFKFKAEEPGSIHAELRVLLIADDGTPTALRSRGGDLRFEVAPAGGSSGAVIYNVHADRILGDIATDKSVSVGTPNAGESMPGPDDWRELVLEYAPDLADALARGGTQGPTRIVERRAKYRSAELMIQAEGLERRTTLVMTTVATLGRNNTNARDGYEPNDITLRVEPTNEPANAAASQRITGHAHLTLTCLGDHAQLRDGSTHGTIVNGREALSAGGETRLDDRIDLRVAGVLDLLVEAFRSASDSPAELPEPTELEQLTAAPRLLDRTLLGIDKPGEIDAVRFRRLNNRAGELEHLVVVRQARIGSSPYDAIQVRAAGVQERHARLVVADGQLWIERLAPDGNVHLNDESVAAGTRVGLVPGDVLRIGEARIELRA